MRLGALNQDKFLRLFDKWSTVEAYWSESSDQFHVKLTLDSEQLDQLRVTEHQLGVDPALVVPKYKRRIRKAPKRGARGAY